MSEDCQNNDVLTEDIVRRVFEFGGGIPKRYYYPIHPKIWDSFLGVGYTEKQLTDWGFIKATYIEVESDIKLER